MTPGRPHRMLVVHNDAGSGGQLQTIEAKPFRRFAFGSLLAYADEVHKQLFERNMVVCESLRLSGGDAVYSAGHLQDVVVDNKYDSVVCHLILDHGGVLSDEFFGALRRSFLKPDGVLLNPVKSISKKDVARASRFDLETQTAPCVVKKNDNYNEPGTVFRFEEQRELDAWRRHHSAEEQRGMVVHKLLDYVGREQSKMYQLERWIVLFDDLTVNHRCSDEFFIKSGTSLSYYVRDERCMARDLERLAESGYNWKGRSIDCGYESDAQGWDARYVVLQQCRDAFHFDYAELDVMQPSRNEFVVIDVNQTPGPSYKNLYFKELAVRLLANGLGIPLARSGSTNEATGARQRADDAAEDVSQHPRGEQDPMDDTKILEEKLTQNPQDAHLRFQLAQSYQRASQLERALGEYKKRAQMDQGSEEERFVAQLEVGRLSVGLGAAESVVLSELLAAYMLRPSRAEPLHELACYFRARQNPAMATLFAKAGVQTPRPDDQLSVVEAVYEWQLLDELGQAAHQCGDHARAQDAFQSLLGRVEAGLTVPRQDLQRILDMLAQVSKSLAQEVNE